MRRTLALVFAAVTSVVALAFLVPFAVVVRKEAAESVAMSARRDGDAIESVLVTAAGRVRLRRAIARTGAGGAGRLAVYFTGPDDGARGGARPGGGTLIGGAQHASAGQLSRAVRAEQSFTASVPGGSVMFLPVLVRVGVCGTSGTPGNGGAGRIAVIEVYIPALAVSRGVATSWAVMAAMATALVGTSVLVGDRTARRITRAARALAEAAAALGGGDLTARTAPAGPPELVAAGRAFNAMAERLSSLIAAERRMTADLPHRLRTPLTVLRMNAGSLGTGRAAEGTRLAVSRLEREIDLIIHAAREPLPGCDAAEVLRDRMHFWSALAEDQGRTWRLAGAESPAPVPVSGADLAAAVDALLGNVFQHTAEGIEFAVTLLPGDGGLLLSFADAGPGIGDPEAALQRGSSGVGSTGLGLDIVRRVAESTGGWLKIDTSVLGGARIQLWLRTGAVPVPRPRNPAW